MLQPSSKKQTLGQSIKTFWTSTQSVFKEVITTPRGIIAWLLANILVNIVWEVALILWVITQDDAYLVFAGAVYAAMWLPPPIEPIFVAVMTVVFYRMLKKKNKITSK
jgi:uncharacterized membrane protein YfcA